jgi:hypothetical protein
MSEPAYWLVFLPGREPEKFTVRAVMRAFVALQKASGARPIVKPVGF